MTHFKTTLFFFSRRQQHKPEEAAAIEDGPASGQCGWSLDDDD